MTDVRDWTEFTPAEAVELGDITQREDVRGPRNEMGEECPWPWEPEQLVGAPLGQYHCRYCGAMVMAGMRHLDYSPDACTQCRELVDYDDPHAGYGMCASCLHDALRSGWEPIP